MDGLVYIVTEVCDYEYGYRSICDVFNSAEKATVYIEERGGNSVIPLWCGLYCEKFRVESYIVR